MTMRGCLPVLTAFVMLAGGSAQAAGELAGPLAAPDPAPQLAAPRPPANSASPPIKFLMRLLSPKAQRQEVQPPAGAAPMVLVPPSDAAPDHDISALPHEPEFDLPAQLALPKKPKPKLPAIRAAVIPIPRPRPPLPPSDAVEAEVAATEDPIDSDEITGSISAPQPRLIALPSPPPGTASSAPPSSPPPPIETAGLMQTEDLLPGDPAQLLGEERGLVPEIWVPENIAPPIPATGSPPAGASGPPPRPTGEPYELMRDLQVLQDQIAQGSVEALSEQRALRLEMDRSFAAAGGKVWEDGRNAAAAVTYVLSGGPPSILRKLQSFDPTPPIDPRLISGVLAYAEGNDREAERHLSELDVARMTPSMGAQLALAKSALAVRTDPAAAMRLLAVARLLAPGTLVEEAALRREIYIADRLKNPAAVEAIARQYLARFRNSVYAGNFRNRFAAAVSRLNFVKDEADFSRVEDLLLLVEPEARGQLYLTLALAAVVKGNVDAGTFAADRALALAPRGSKDEARAQLYRAASLIADPAAFDAAADAIGRSDRDLLSASDQRLRDAVAATIAGVRKGTEVAAETKRTSLFDNRRSEPVESTPLMTRARDALSATDELVKGMAR